MAPHRGSVVGWRRVVLGAGVLFLTACAAEHVEGPSAAPSPSPRPTAAPTARYEVTFEATWSAGSHPTDFPASAHFSGLVGGTHGPAVSFWAEGGLATEGIRLMAERGRQTPLDLEVGAAVAAGTAEHVLVGDGIPRSPGSTRLEFEISRKYPLVTLVTMVAPSPDWFVGVSGMSLLENGDWVAARTIDLLPWDAGTDSGRTYQAADEVTSPPEGIRRLQGRPVVVGSAVPPMGRFVFRRLS